MRYVVFFVFDLLRNARVRPLIMSSFSLLSALFRPVFVDFHNAPLLERSGGDVRRNEIIPQTFLLVGAAAGVGSSFI